MSQKGKEARALFEQGYNCAQAVAGAFAAEMGLPQETVVRMVSPFGGGMGRLREVCGAFSGALFVLGVLYGYDDAKANEEKMQLYKEVQELAAKFTEQNGSFICRDLLGLHAGASDPQPAPRTPQYYHDRRCSDAVESAATLMEAFIGEHPLG